MKITTGNGLPFFGFRYNLKCSLPLELGLPSLLACKVWRNNSQSLIDRVMFVFSGSLEMNIHFAFTHPFCQKEHMEGSHDPITNIACLALSREGHPCKLCRLDDGRGDLWWSHSFPLGLQPSTTGTFGQWDMEVGDDDKIHVKYADLGLHWFRTEYGSRKEVSEAENSWKRKKGNPILWISIMPNYRMRIQTTRQPFNILQPSPTDDVKYLGPYTPFMKIGITP